MSNWIGSSYCFSLAIALSCIFGPSWFAKTAWTAEQTIRFQSLSPDLKSVPQTLLNLVHAEEVQQELNIPDSKQTDFVSKLQAIDGPWWRARILPEDEQRKITAVAENALISELASIAGPEAVNRLRQIELQSQGIRMLLRPEVIAYIKLSSEQRAQLEKLFAATDSLGSKSQSREGKGDEKVMGAFQTAKQTEAEKGFKLLQPEQQQRLQRALGALVATAKLERIYPLAPELVDSGVWLGTPVSLSSLRGKVVLVHYYAFQCSNCQANFHIYNRWHKSLSDKGVVVIGIQTPETSAEREPAKVIAAAKKDGFNFPVLVDLTNANWDAWANTMWPTVYVIDKKGYVRHWWQGELNWQGATADKSIEAMVDRLLKD